MQQWLVKSFEELTAKEIYQIFKLRQDVFIVEQDCVYPDIDDKDQNAMHVMGLSPEGQLLAYTRVFRANDYFPNYTSFGRVATSQAARGKGIGRELIKETLQFMDRTYQEPCKISAQSYLEKFYNDYGFETVGEEYLEDGIPHIAMIREL